MTKSLSVGIRSEKKKIIESLHISAANSLLFAWTVVARVPTECDFHALANLQSLSKSAIKQFFLKSAHI